MNKKGFALLSAGAMMVLVLVILIAVFLVVTIKNYNQQYEKGDKILNNFTLSVGTIASVNGSKTESIFGILDGPKTDNKISIEIIYSTKDYKESDEKIINHYKPKNLGEERPVHLPPYIIVTAEQIDYFGNNFKGCLKVKLVYKQVNLIKLFKGMPKRELPECIPWNGNWGKK